MKKFIAILTILLLAACSAARPDAETATEIIVPTSTYVPTATSTIALTATLEMEAMPIENRQDALFIEKEYDPIEWDQLFDDNMVWEIGITSKQEIYLKLDRGGIAYLDGDTWKIFSLADLGLHENSHDMVVAPDDTIWLANRSTVSHYINNQWETYSMPEISNTSFIRLAVDSNGVLWVSQAICYCENSILKFDGNKWSNLPGESFDLDQLLFTPDGTLWGALGGVGILNYDGESWGFNFGEDVWGVDMPFMPTYRVASDQQGKVYAITDHVDSIAVWNLDGSIELIPFDPSFSLNGFMLRLFVDSHETIWMNACLENESNSCLAFYQDAQWYKFVNLPFSSVTDIKKLSTGTYLVATEKGVFQYSPSN